MIRDHQCAYLKSTDIWQLLLQVSTYIGLCDDMSAYCLLCHIHCIESWGAAFHPANVKFLAGKLVPSQHTSWQHACQSTKQTCRNRTRSHPAASGGSQYSSIPGRLGPAPATILAREHIRRRVRHQQLMHFTWRFMTLFKRCHW